MQIRITWANQYPIEGEPEKDTTTDWKIVPDDELDLVEVEKQAILDTPSGHILSEISLPGVSYQYDAKGVKTEIITKSR